MQERILMRAMTEVAAERARVALWVVKLRPAQPVVKEQHAPGLQRRCEAGHPWPDPQAQFAAIARHKRARDGILETCDLGPQRSGGRARRPGEFALDIQP